jgi:hypothetical protein
MILLDLVVVDVNECGILCVSVHSISDPEGEKEELGAVVVEPIISAQIEPLAELLWQLSLWLRLQMLLRGRL